MSPSTNAIVDSNKVVDRLLVIFLNQKYSEGILYVHFKRHTLFKELKERKKA